MAYDVGGYNLMAVGKKGTELLNVTAAKPILMADLSPDGYVCYSTPNPATRAFCMSIIPEAR